MVEMSGTDAPRLLTNREREVLGMASRGLTNGQIAVELEVTVHAIKFHLASAFRKLGAANRTEAVVRFIQGYPDGQL